MNKQYLSALLTACVFTTAVGCASRRPLPTPPPATPPEIPTSPAPAPPPGDTVEQLLPADLIELNQELSRRGLLGDIHFELNEYALDQRARERLAKNGEFLLAHPEYQLTIEGHCDERGTNEYNLALGDRRAAVARDYLVRLGVRGQLRAVSYGEERPQCRDTSESCWTMNRRAHFVISGRTDES